MLSEKNKDLSIILKNISQTENGATPENILKKFIKELHSAINSYLTICWIVAEEQEEKLKLFAQFGLSDSGIKKFEADFPTGKKILKTIERQQTTIEDISSLESSPLKTFLIEEGISSVAEIPFFKNGNLYGILEIYLKDKEDIETAKQFFCNVSALLTALNNIFDAKLSNDEEIKKTKQAGDEIISKLIEKNKSQEKELADLKKIQEFTVGRELVMSELKDKIKNLEKKLEECNKSSA